MPRDKMKTEAKIYALASTPVVKGIVLLALLLFLAYLVLENNSLRTQLSNTENELNKTIEEKEALNINLAEKEGEIRSNRANITRLTLQLEQTSEELNATTLSLGQVEKELNDTKKELETSTSSLTQLREEFRSLAENLTEMERSINESISWFEDNSYLTPSTSYFAPYVTGKCVVDETLNLGCVALFMEKRVGLEYKTEPTDRLYSIDEIVNRGGGDCEDYSLFVKALLNTLASSDGNLELLGWKEGSGQFKVYETGSGSFWYYPGHGFSLGTLNKLHPSSICYLTDISGEVPVGHCIIALSKDVVRSVEDLQNLNGAVTLEPQNGQYMGTVGTEFNLCREGEVDCGQAVGDTYIIMTDDDVYRFNNGVWESLGSYRATVETLRLKIITESSS